MVAGLLLMALFTVTVGAGLLRRRRWSLWLLIGLWLLQFALSALPLILGTVLLPIGPRMPGEMSGLGGLAISAAVQLFMLYYLLGRSSEFS